MKKVLLTTSALTLLAGAAAADVSVGVIPVLVFKTQDQQQQTIYVIRLRSLDQQLLMADLLLVRGQELVTQQW